MIFCMLFASNDLFNNLDNDHEYSIFVETEHFSGQDIRGLILTAAEGESEMYKEITAHATRRHTSFVIPCYVSRTFNSVLNGIQVKW